MRIQTVLGPIDPDELGPTRMHEHTFSECRYELGSCGAIVDEDLLAPEEQVRRILVENSRRIPAFQRLVLAGCGSAR